MQSLWEMLVARLQRVKQQRTERVEQKKAAVVEQQQRFKHLLTVPYSPNYQTLVDQIMNHDPFGSPLLQRGRFVSVEEAPEKVVFPHEETCDSCRTHLQENLGRGAVSNTQTSGESS